MADLCPMELETGPFRANISHCAAFGAASCKKPLEQQPSFLLQQGLQQQQASATSGLMRYHSAPSSILASLLEDEGFLLNQREFRPLPSIEESEFGQLFSTNSSYDLSFSTNLCNRRPSDHSFEAKAAGPAMNVQMPLHYQQQQQQHQHTQHHQQQQHHQKQRFQHNQQQPVQPYRHGEGCTPQSVPVVVPLQHHQFNTAAPLPAILENSLDVPVDNFCSPLLPAPLEANHIKPPGMISQEDAVKQPKGGMKQCSSPAECNPVQQGSSSTDFLAPITEDSDRRPAPVFSDIQKIVESMAAENSKANPFAQATTGPVESVPIRLVNHCKPEVGSSGSPPEILEGGLIRHSSSPAGLLSQWTSDGMSTISERMSTSASSGNSSEDGTFDKKSTGLSMLGNQRGGAWDDVGRRKRGRGNEAKLLYGMPQGSAECNALSNQCGLVSVTSLDRSSFDAVLCKARAKRGCATHPRSIAERVRRTKISERMRRLQELVPNMDKQTNTAEMLDEAVEYIKSLQCQVQELTENRPKCNGMCKQKGNASADA